MKETALIFIILLSVMVNMSAQTMLIDEDFSDWSPDKLLYEDVTGDGANNSLDFHRVWMADDEKNIYLRIELGREIELQEFDDLFLYIDIDNDISTGIFTQNIGADFVYGFGERDGFLKVGNEFYDIFHSDINLITLPTVSSAEFEMSISKSIDHFQGPTLISPQFNFAFVDNKPQGDRIPNIGAISYEMSLDSYSPPLPDLIKVQDSDIRIISYNALSDGLFDTARQPAFKRIIRAMEPQIICFQEVYDHSSLQVAQLMEVFLPSVQNQQWYHSRVNPDIILVSRYPISSTSSTDGNGIFEIDVQSEPVILVGAHLPCCNNEIERQLEIDRLMSFIRNSIDGLTNMAIADQTPIFVVGDMNLVGLKQQQISLLTGDIVNENLFGADFSPDWDGSSLEDALPFLYGQPHAVTWLNSFGSFSAGRLDYMLYTGSVVDVNNSFSLQTRNLSTSDLNAFNLEASDSETASDHFACVMDVDLSPESSVRSIIDFVFKLNVSPNPASETITFSTTDFVEAEDAAVTIRSLDGRIHLQSSVQVIGYSSIQLAIDHLIPGAYLVELKSIKGVFISKFIKL